MAASAIFDRNVRSRTRRDARKVLTAAAGMDRFTIDDVASAAGSSLYYGTAQRLLRLLWQEGHLRRLNPPRSKPLVYEWVEA